MFKAELKELSVIKNGRQKERQTKGKRKRATKKPLTSLSVD